MADPDATGRFEPIQPLTDGTPFGPRYKIRKTLGAGGMGVVYQAWDSELGVDVALKIIREDAATDPETAREIERRFKRELLLARQVTHKHVVRIHDLGDVAGVKYITMPYIAGLNLAQLLRNQEKLPLDQALRFAQQIAAGLQAAHEAGVVHRDLKPENIMIDADGQALIMDFGISQSMAGGMDATRTGGVVGTLEYMAPEQAGGATVDHRADIYAFGLILYDMLAGRKRLTSASGLSELMNRMQKAPALLRTAAPNAPPDVERIVMRCLELDPAKRYDTTAALVADLSALTPEGRLQTPPAARRQLPLTAVVAGAALVALLIGGGWWFMAGRTPPAAPVQRAPLSMLIADFENKAGDPSFDGVLEQALGMSMEGASFLTNYNRLSAKQIAAKMGIEGGLDESAARLVAKREGIKIVLSGAIASEGTGYRIDVKAIDPENGKELAQKHVSARSKSEILNAMSTLSGEARNALGDSVPAGATGAADETYTTKSLQALAAYDQGQALNRAGKAREAIDKFEEAVRLDPDFGRAYVNLASIHVNLKQFDQAEAKYQMAFKHLDRMSEREKYRTLGMYYLGVSRNYEKAIENFDALVKAYPADNAGWANLALSHMYARNVSKAASTGKHAVDIYPTNVLQRTNYATYSMLAGDFATAVKETERVLTENAAYEWAGLTLALSNIAQGRNAEARAAYERLRQTSTLGASLASMGEADLEMFHGRYTRALEVLKDGIALDEKNADDSNLALKLVAAAEAHLASGNKAEAARFAERAATLSSHEAVLVPAAHVLAQSGREARAAAIAAQFEKMIPAHLRSYAHIINADVKLRRGNAAQALDDLRAAQKLHDSWLVHARLGAAYYAAKLYPEALAEWDACLKRRGEATDVFIADSSSIRYLPDVYEQLTKAQEAMGDTAAARASRDALGKMRQ